MEQVEEICKTIALINKGQLILNGAVSEIKQQFKENKYVISFDKLPMLETSDLFVVDRVEDNTITVKLNATTAPNAILQYFIGTGAQITAYYELLPSLNDILSPL